MATEQCVKIQIEAIVKVLNTLSVPELVNLSRFGTTKEEIATGLLDIGLKAQLAVIDFKHSGGNLNISVRQEYVRILMRAGLWFNNLY